MSKNVIHGFMKDQTQLIVNNPMESYENIETYKDVCSCIVKSVSRDMMIYEPRGGGGESWINSGPPESRFSRITQRIDTSKVRYGSLRNNGKNSVLSSIDYVKDVNWDKTRPQRGGVIPYTVKDGEVYFGMGIDTKTGDLTDFGGGIRYKKDGDAITGSLREFMEESLCIFGAYDSHAVQNNVVVYTDTMMIIFLHFDVNMERINEIFDSRVRISKYFEISSLIWIPKSIFVSCIKTGWLTTPFCNRRLYFRVRRLLQSCINFCSFL